MANRIRAWCEDHHVAEVVFMVVLSVIVFSAVALAVVMLSVMLAGQKWVCYAAT